MRQIVTLLIMFAFLFVGCKSSIKLQDIILTDLKENNIPLKSLLSDSCTVIVFYSPECPMSENYTLIVNNLQKKYTKKAVKFLSVVPGKYYSKSDINAFMIKYKLNYDLFLDPENKLVKLLDAHITPECFAINSNHEVVYQGAIDNWAIDLGQKRTVVNENYLDDAIFALLHNEPVQIPYVKPVGCHIE